MNKRNIIWIIIDGVRNYSCPHDPEKMGKPEIFNDIAREGIDFTTVVSAGTTTSMSLVSYLTSIPSFFLGHNFHDFFTDEYRPPTLTNILKEHGYKIYSICIGADFRRDRWKKDLPHVSSRYWPKGAYQLSYWPNPILTQVLENLLNDGIEAPFLFYMHFNGRRDAEVSKKIKYCLSLFKNKGLYDESIIILCSDHGMPDDARNKYTTWLREQGLSYSRHDLITTDDNILVPLVLRIPGYPAGIKIEEPVGTIDLFPTLLELLGLSNDCLNQDGIFYGKSILPLIRGVGSDAKYKQELTKRKFRTDTRFMGQADCITSIRGSKYKYVFSYDVEAIKQEQFYDLKNDSNETQNLVGSNDSSIQKKISEYRDELKKSNDTALTYQLNIREVKFQNFLNQNLNGCNHKNKMMFLLIGSCHIKFTEMVVHLLKKVYPDDTVDLLLERLNPHNPEELNKFGFRNNLYVGDKFNARAFKSSYIDHLGVGAILEKYDVILVPFTNYYQEQLKSRQKTCTGKMQINVPQAEPGSVEGLNLKIIQDYKEIFKIVKSLRCKNKIYFDTNFHFYKHPKLAVLGKNLKKALDKRDIYLNQPTEIFRDMKVFFGFKKRKRVNW